MSDRRNIEAILMRALRFNAIDMPGLKTLRAYIQWVDTSEMATEEDAQLAERVRVEILGLYNN